MVRLLGYLLLFGEPAFFAVAASGAFNAVSVRGMPVVLMLLARLVSTATCAAAGRALLDGRAAGRMLATAGLAASGLVQAVAVLTPFFPSNRAPGLEPVYVAALTAYYGGWLAFVRWSPRLAASRD